MITITPSTQPTTRPVVVIDPDHVDYETYYLTIETVGNGKVLVDPKGECFRYDSKIRLSAVPDRGWEFHHWEGDVESNNPIINVTMDADKPVTAVFPRIPVNMVELEVVPVGHGIVARTPAGVITENGSLYPEGTTVTLEADPDAGWGFLGFFDESGVLLVDDEVADLVLNDDFTIVARFEKLAPPPPPPYWEQEVIAADGQFLGVINDDPFDPESLANPYGVYGDQFSVLSVWNSFSIYGSEFSDLSAYDPFAADPPGVYLNGVLMGFLTTNPDFFPQIDPDEVAVAIGRYDVIR